MILKIERYIWITTVVILSLLLINPVSKANALSSEAEEKLHIFHEILGIIQTNYVEKVEEKSLYNGAINGLLRSLGDPHSRFMDKDALKSLQSETKGSFSGLGIEVTYANGYLTIISPIDDTPATRAGIQPQDIIMEINGNKTKEISLMNAIKMMRGEAGSSITLKLKRNGEKDLVTVSLVREVIPIHSVKSQMLKK